MHSRKSKIKELDEEKNLIGNPNEEEIKTIFYGIKKNGLNLKKFSANKELEKYNNNEINRSNNFYKKLKSRNIVINDEIKKKLSPELIKSFYKAMKIRGYSSYIPNKDTNTLLKRKFRKKYRNNSETDIVNIKHGSGKLPKINLPKYYILSDKGI